MDRTLFTPAMIETFRICQRAYEFAFVRNAGRSQTQKLSSFCKRFLLRTFAEINRGRLKTMSEAQKFIGQNWSLDKVMTDNREESQERGIQAFRFAYRAILSYVENPYRPANTEVVAVGLKLRARIPHGKVYLEDVFDLVLFHKNDKVLEIVDFHLGSRGPLDPAWPGVAMLVRQFLTERLKTRCDFQRVVHTYARIHQNGIVVSSQEMDPAVFRLHWPELVNTVERMKDVQDYTPQRSESCKSCEFLSPCLSMGGYKSDDSDRSLYCHEENNLNPFCRTA